MVKLKTTMGVFWINTICTLKCKHCITLTPYHKKAENFSLEQICADIDGFYSVYDWVEHMDLEGGETLLHPDIVGIVRKSFEYRSHFGRFHILTNGTVVPSEELLRLCQELKNVFFILDDYGPELSVNIEEIKSLLAKYGIDYRVDTYYGENQYYDGWLDFGDMHDCNYSAEELLRVFNNCRAAHCGSPYVKNGKMFLCPRQGANVEYIGLKKGEYVDFSVDNVEEWISVAKSFGVHPISTCSYCKGFDAKNGKRYPAAIQLDKRVPEEERICL